MVVVGPPVGLDVVVVGFPGVVSGGGPGTKEHRFQLNFLTLMKSSITIILDKSRFALV